MYNGISPWPPNARPQVIHRGLGHRHIKSLRAHMWKANVTCVFKKEKKEDPGNYRQVRLTSTPGKVMEQLIMESISRHMNDKKVVKVHRTYLCMSSLPKSSLI